jgi:hypothetical protein
VFYFIPPTPENLKRYSTWSSSPRQTKVFFGNEVDICYETHVYAGILTNHLHDNWLLICLLLTGQTLLIPTGWIHAVFTPVDSLVFGGNFLHGLNCRFVAPGHSCLI